MLLTSFGCNTSQNQFSTLLLEENIFPTDLSFLLVFPKKLSLLLKNVLYVFFSPYADGIAAFCPLALSMRIHVGHIVM